MPTRIGMEHTLPVPGVRFQFHGRMEAFEGVRRSPSEIYELNLRYQLLQRMKVHGLRSLASQHHVCDSHVKEQRDTGGPSWDSRHHLSPQPQGCSSIGTRTISPRFRGRINLPQQRSSFPEDHRIPDFAGPKSLAELKGGKEKKQLHSPGGGGHRNPKVGPEEGFDTAFEAPKPLSVILKRKREETGGMTSSSYNCDDEVGPKKRVKDGLGGTSVPETCSAAAYSPSAKFDYAHNYKEECKPNEDAADDVADVDQAVEDQGNDQESDYKLLHGLECDSMNEGENADTDEEEEDLLEGDDEDEDTFARSIGVFLT